MSPFSFRSISDTAGGGSSYDFPLGESNGSPGNLSQTTESGIPYPVLGWTGVTVYAIVRLWSTSSPRAICTGSPTGVGGGFDGSGLSGSEGEFGEIESGELQGPLSVWTVVAELESSDFWEHDPVVIAIAKSAASPIGRAMLAVA